MHDICRQAGLSQRYFYEAFAGREELFVALLEQIAADVRTVMRAAVATPDRTPEQRADDVLEALAAFFVDDPRTVRVALIESCATPAFRVHRTALLEAFADFAATLMRALHPAERHPDEDGLRRSALILSGGVAELLMGMASGSPVPDRRGLLRHLAALVRAAAVLR